MYILILDHSVYPKQYIRDVLADVAQKIAVLLFTVFCGELLVLFMPTDGELIPHKLQLCRFGEMIEFRDQDFSHPGLWERPELSDSDGPLLFAIKEEQIVHEGPVRALRLGECCELDLELLRRCAASRVPLLRLHAVYALEEVEEDRFACTAQAAVLTATSIRDVFFLLSLPFFLLRYDRVVRVLHDGRGPRQAGREPGLQEKLALPEGAHAERCCGGTHAA